MERLLIVDDEKHTRDGLAQAFEDKFDVFTASSPEEAFRLLDTERFAVVITDLRMGQASGMSVIDKTLQLPNHPICILMTAYGTIEVAVEAMKHGAYDFISKPIQLDQLESMVDRAMTERYHPEKPAVSLDGTPNMLGSSPAFNRLMQQIQLVAPTKTTVLITGETGTGKELVAHQLHQLSARAAEKFVPIHCAALPVNLLESGLFGYERGAFTGALQRRIGLFETAQNGTLFLDEIGEIDLPTQIKLLRFLETKTIERVGGTQPIHLDVRLVCATNRNLKTEVEQGRFRQDLYYRLNVVEIHVPSLRERREDIVPLVQHYLKVFARENHLKAPVLSLEVAGVLEGYLWPGNVRELRNFAENAVIMHAGNTLGLSDIDAKFLAPEVSIGCSQDEASMLRQMLQKTNGNKSEIARLLNIPRRTLYRKLQKYKLL